MSMENKKLTAVEWLFRWMQHNQYFIGDDLIKAKEYADSLFEDQIEKAFENGVMAEAELNNLSCSQEYYQNTYGNKESN